jgi:hypothetical protein
MAQMGSYAMTTCEPQDECSRSSISSATALGFRVGGLGFVRRFVRDAVIRGEGRDDDR